MAEKKEPLLLLDNSTMYVIGAGDYHSTNLTFEEAKAIIDSGEIGEVQHVQAYNNVPYGGCYYHS